MTGTQPKLNVPAGSNHDPAFGGTDNSVRVVQSIANTDFTGTVKFDSIPNQFYEFEGIVVNQDAANYLRFQFGSTASTLYVTASVILAHKETSEFSIPITLPSGSLAARAESRQHLDRELVAKRYDVQHRRDIHLGVDGGRHRAVRSKLQSCGEFSARVFRPGGFLGGWHIRDELT
jgi:hypothetical protein